jgi:hypothetical protein
MKDKRIESAAWMVTGVAWLFMGCSNLYKDKTSLGISHVIASGYCFYIAYLVSQRP